MRRMLWSAPLAQLNFGRNILDRGALRPPPPPRWVRIEIINLQREGGGGEKKGQNLSPNSFMDQRADLITLILILDTKTYGFERK
jgi:hypothetical protein